ncbi:MAG: hypothetical protein IJ563_11795 [Selenomonadaceae bacterium]|nr:hypothetical protein [Selenomonadaceae bacterium]
MDKIMLNKEDITFLFEWRDKNKELVRTLPNPLKIVEIVFSHNDIRIKGVRKEKLLALYVYNGQLKIGKAEFEISIDNLLVKRKGKMNMTRESFESILSCYCTLMAYMVYEKPELVKVSEETNDTPTEKKCKSRQNKGKRTNVTYIIRRRKESSELTSVVHHASPKGIFTVRGHLRHYKNGNVIWIKEYKKGTGNKKLKVYKLGKNTEQVEEGKC